MGLNICGNCARDCDYKDKYNTNSNSSLIYDTSKNFLQTDSTKASSKNRKHNSRKNKHKKV